MGVEINITVNGEKAELDVDGLDVEKKKTKTGQKTVLELPEKVEGADEKSILDMFMF